jgi:hypothetical protein
MKLNQLIAFFASILLFASCNSPNRTDGTQNSVTDSTSFRDGAYAGLLEKFKAVNILAFTADTTLMFRLEKYDSLGTNEVKQLDKNWATLDSSGSEEYTMREFYQIDSIKASGNYATWCDSLQPGMTKSSNACAIARISIDDKNQLLIWGLATSSYEACPFTTAQEVYVSMLANDVLVKTFKLAEYISSADPPVAMQRMVSGTINKDLTVDLSVYQENDEDMDLPDLIVTKETYHYAIKNGKLSLLSGRKEPPVKVKRKKQE